MILQKNSTSLQKIQYFLIVLSLVFIFPTFSFAEEEKISQSYCPIDGFADVSFADVGVSDGGKIEDTFSGLAKLGNSTQYTINDIKVAIAIYESSDTSKPKYWSILPGNHQLSSGQTSDIIFNLDATILSAGKYEAKVFVAQGNETVVLGTILHESSKKTGLSFTKSAEAKSNIDITLEVDEKMINEGSIYVDIVTTNKNKTPLFESKMLGVITQGDVPLGTAVWSDKLDVVKLIPNDYRKTKIKNDQVIPGSYTIYAGLMSEGILQSIESKSIKFGGNGDEDLTWPYLSKIGLSDYPLNSNSEIIACVDYIGTNEGSDRLLEPLAINASIVDKSGKTVEEKIASLSTSNYFTFKPKDSFQDFDLNVDFFQQKFPSEFVGEGEFKAEDNLAKVSTLKQTFSCPSSEICNLNNNESLVGVPTVPVKNNFWFYGGVVIAALLLMYLMLRRLGPDVDDDAKKLSQYELH